MDDSEHDDGATATTSTYELASLSRAERRPSRSEASRPFGFQAFTSLTPASAAPTTIPITPPDTPGVSDDESRGDVFLQSKDPYAPVVEESLPPTPLEPAFNGAGPFDSAAAIEAALKVAAEVAGADSNAAFESDPEDEAGTAHGGERELATLPRVDGGREALTFLAAAFCIEGLVWGLPYSVGVLHEYWSSHLFPGDAAESTLTLASTLSTGLLFFSGAPLGPLFTAFPWYEKHFQVAGLVIAVGGLIGSAFATQPWHLVLTFGILYPCSAATYMPCATNIFEWFQERRGLATGIMYAGTGTGGALYPIITTALLNKFGYKATMIALALSFAVLNLAALPFIRRRIPLAKHLNGASKRRMRPKVDFSFLKTRAAWIAFTFMTVTSLANFIPLLWIPSYATAINAQRPNGAALVSVINGITAGGNALSGYLSDRIRSRIIVTLWTVIAGLSCVVLWGFGTNVGVLTAFAVVWGITGGSLAGFWGNMIATISGGDPTIPPIAFSIFITLKGIGCFTSGPVSTALLTFDGFRGAAGAYGTNYGILFIYTGVMTFVGGIVLVAFPG